MMKVLYVVKTNRGAGWAYKQAEWVLNNEKDIEFIIVLPSEKGGFADQYSKLGCRIIAEDFSLPVKQPWKLFEKKKIIQQIISREAPDIIHSHFVTTTFMLRIALRNNSTKRVFQVPGPLHLERRFFCFLDKALAQDNDYWIGTCQWTVNKYLKMGINDKKVFLDYYGASLTPIYYEGKKLHEDLNIPDDKQIVGMVSYFYKPKYYLFQFRGIKGHEDFIKAISLVSKRYPNVMGVIIGNAWTGAEAYERKIHSLANKICPKNIVFAGYRNDVREIYHEMTVAVHPSLSENLGGAAQSISQCVPTVSTNVGGFPDIVIDGVTGWTVNPHAPNELADKIIWFLEHKQESLAMAIKGRELYEKKLSLDVTARRLVDIYRDMLKQ